MAKEVTTKKKRKIDFTGVAMLFVVASIIFMSVIIYMGTDDLVSKALTVPAVVFAAAELVKRFSK
jgi:nitrogen fixation protein FixH